MQLPRQIVIMILLFLMQMIICEIGFVVGLNKRKQFLLRVLIGIPLYVGSVIACAFIRGYLPGNESYLIEHLKGIAYFCAITLINALLVYGCFDIPYTGALFTAIGAYSIEHIASRISYILKACVYVDQEVPPAILYGVFDFLVPLIVSTAFYFLLIRKSIADRKMRYNDSKVLFVSGVNLFICIALSIFEPNIGDGSLESVLVLCSNYGCALLACSLCLLLQVGYFRESELDEKNRILAEMLEMERKKQGLSKETIEIINRKCHDLRHQIRLLEEQSPEERTDSLKNIRDAIHIYDSLVKTGNSSVDLVLMEKKLFCEKYDIKFTYLVDGKRFDFMDDADIYAMLGNMLENAIESVQKEPDPEKRIITFHARAKSDMLYISMENYCSKPVKFKDGLPETIKNDKAFHGFGVKSIRHIAENYGGSVRFINENNSFLVEILMPLPTTKAA